MTRLHIAVGITLLGASCAWNAVQRPGESAHEWEPVDAGLRWLVTQQRADGYWGSEAHRVRLTSLAILAFLSGGETPASAEFADAVEAGIAALVAIGDSPSDLADDDRALLVWCLTEASLVTREPAIMDVASTQMRWLTYDNPGPWHGQAVVAVSIARNDPDSGRQALKAIQSGLPDRPDRLLNQATHLYLAGQLGDQQRAGHHLEAIRRLNPGRWSETEDPWRTAPMLSLALLWHGRGDWEEWSQKAIPKITGNQQRRGGLGWWAPRSVGRATTGVGGLSRQERDIYVTSLMLLSFPPHRVRPPYQEIEIPMPENDAGGDIVVEIL